MVAASRRRLDQRDHTASPLMRITTRSAKRPLRDAQIPRARVRYDARACAVQSPSRRRSAITGRLDHDVTTQFQGMTQEVLDLHFETDDAVEEIAM